MRLVFLGGWVFLLRVAPHNKQAGRSVYKMSGQKVLTFCCVSTLPAGGFVDLPVVLSVAKQTLRRDLLSEPRRLSLDWKCQHQADVQSAVTFSVLASADDIKDQFVIIKTTYHGCKNDNKMLHGDASGPKVTDRRNFNSKEGGWLLLIVSPWSHWFWVFAVAVKLSWLHVMNFCICGFLKLFIKCTTSMCCWDVARREEREKTKKKSSIFLSILKIISS